MPVPTHPGPCDCCAPWGITPMGAMVTIAGFKDNSYGTCTECADINGTYSFSFPAEGCGIGHAISACGGVDLFLKLETDADNHCRSKWILTIIDAGGSVIDLMFEKGGLLCCFGDQDLARVSGGTLTACDEESGGITVSVAPFGDWEEDYATACLPALTESCPAPAPVERPLLRSQELSLASVCSKCGCSQGGDDLGLDQDIPCATCSGQSASPINGNMSQTLRMPPSDPVAPTEILTYNSAPMFGQNSPFADATTASPPAGAQVSGLITARLIADDANAGAATSHCDGSINQYRCQHPTTKEYWPVGTRNSLVENVDGNGDRLGWTEVTQPDGFTWEYDADGNLTSVENPAGQTWTAKRSSTAMVGSSFKRVNAIEDPLSRRMTYTYDTNDRLRRIEGVDGRLTTVTMDANGNLTKFITPELCTTEFRYGSGYAGAHQMMARISEDGTRTSFSYHDSGWVSTVETPNNGKTSFTFDDLTSATVTKPNGTRTSLTFNSSRQVTAVSKPDTNDAEVEADCTTVTKITKPSGAEQDYKYELVDDKVPRMVSQANADGRTTFVYAAANKSQQPDAVIDRQGRRTSFTWDGNGQQTSIRNPLNEITTHVYDSSSRKIATIDALGNRTSVVYNATSQPAAAINALGQRTSFTYSDTGQPLARQNPLGAVWTTQSDLNNRPVVSIDPLGNRTSNVYASGCTPIGTISPMGARTTNIFQNGLLAASVNPLGHRSSFAYNSSGSRIRSTSPSGLITTNVYDVNQRPLATISPAGLRSTNVYDATGRIVAQVQPSGIRTTTIYDTCCSKPKATIAPNGARTSFTFNAAGLQIRTTQPTGGITTTIYDDLDRQIATINPLGHRSSVVYDGVGQTIAQIDALNNRSTSVYNAAGQSVASVNPLGNRNSTVYNEAGQAAAAVNPLGNRWSSVYDSAGRTIASVDPLNRRSTSIYDDDGNVIASIDPAGGRTTTLYNIGRQTVGSIDASEFRTTNTYNADGQAVEHIDALGYRTTSVYDSSGRSVASIDARGNRETTIYNSNGQAVASENALGNRWTTVLNSAGQSVANVDPLSNRTSSVYDTAGRVVAGIDPLGNRSTTIYNIASQVVASENALGYRTSNVFDVNGRTLVEISALGYRTTTVYDDSGQRTALVDARSNRHSFVYDAFGQETVRIDPLGRRTTFGYDMAGQQERRTDARGNRPTYTYSDNGQLTTRKYPDGTRATFAYDAVGNRTLMANGTGRYSYSYDGNAQTSVAANPNNKTITYVYDPVGNRAHMDAPDAGRFTYVYDATNQITLLHNPFDERTSFVYDNAGRRTVKKLANGTSASFTYDAASNLTNLHNLKSDNSVISSFDYRYNEVNNRTAIGEANGDRITWTYDNASQLTSEHRSGANAYSNTFVYDPVGNRLVLNEDATRTTTVFDAANQIEYSQATAGRTTYTFDADGNQQIMALPSADRITNTWDYENRLTTVALPNATRVTNTYHPDNLRVSSDDGTSSKTWLWNDQNLVSQTESGVLVVTNTPDLYGDLISQNNGTNTKWYHFDARGDSRELSDASEIVTDTRCYDAWGNILSSTGTTEMPFLFGGELGYTSSQDLEYVRARWYSPTNSHWLSPDPLLFVNGPNIYSYVRNAPSLTLDPSGLTPDLSCVHDSRCGPEQWRMYHRTRCTFADLRITHANLTVKQVDKLKSLADLTGSPSSALGLLTCLAGAAGNPAKSAKCLVDAGLKTSPGSHSAIQEFVRLLTGPNMFSGGSVWITFKTESCRGRKCSYFSIPIWSDVKCNVMDYKSKTNTVKCDIGAQGTTIYPQEYKDPKFLERCAFEMKSRGGCSSITDADPWDEDP